MTTDNTKVPVVLEESLPISKQDPIKMACS